MIEFHGELYFVADDGSTGLELWKLTPVPESTTSILVLIGFFLVAGYAWRNRRRPVAAS